jgi:hypothetical protein
VGARGRVERSIKSARGRFGRGTRSMTGAWGWFGLVLAGCARGVDALLGRSVVRQVDAGDGSDGSSPIICYQYQS